MLNLLVWATPVAILSEDEAGTTLHKEHHLRAAGLNQRLAAAVQDDPWIGREGMSETAGRRGKEKRELEDKEHAYLMRSEQSKLQSKEWMPESCETIVMGSKQATPGEETTKMTQAKLQSGDMLEEEWARMNEEIEECKKMA